MRGVHTWPAFLAVGLVLGCQPRLPDVDGYGQRVAVGAEANVELCAGTLVAFDEHVRFVEEELKIARPAADTINVFMLQDTAPWCRDVEACYIGGWVDATFVPVDAAQSVWHELVHQVVAGSDIGMTDRFLSEGLAGALGDDWCPSPDSAWRDASLVDLLGRGEVAFEDYPQAAAFVDFVRESYGTDALVELVGCVHRGDPMAQVQRCFQRVFETSVAEVGRQFAMVGPQHHPNPALCRGPVDRWTGEAWTREIALSCDAPGAVNTFTAPQAREVATLVEIPHAGWYDLSVVSDGAAHASIEPCFCATSGPGLVEDPGGGAVWIGETGTHRLVVTTEDPSATHASLVLAPLGVPGRVVLGPISESSPPV